MVKITLVVLICTGCLVAISTAQSSTPSPAEALKAYEEDSKDDDIIQAHRNCHKEGFRGLHKDMKHHWHHCKNEHHGHHKEQQVCRHLCLWKKWGWLKHDGEIDKGKIEESSGQMFENKDIAKTHTEDFIECHKNHHEHLKSGDHHKDNCKTAKELHECLVEKKKHCNKHHTTPKP